MQKGKSGKAIQMLRRPLVPRSQHATPKINVFLFPHLCHSALTAGFRNETIRVEQLTETGKLKQSVMS